MSQENSHLKNMHEWIRLYLGKINVWMFTVHTEEIPHKWKSQRSWRIIWRIPVFEEVCYYDQNKYEEKKHHEVKIQQDIIQPHRELNQQQEDSLSFSTLCCSF